MRAPVERASAASADGAAVVVVEYLETGDGIHSEEEEIVDSAGSAVVDDDTAAVCAGVPGLGVVVAVAENLAESVESVVGDIVEVVMYVIFDLVGGAEKVVKSSEMSPRIQREGLMAQVEGRHGEGCLFCP
mmetsp:Transcript_2088/g.2176  ORF Transcript_2088/g.2176 Transcript_2088/m.2176 type:complete len:131 (-) Transcript_2088:1550-1942(-)